MNAPDNLQEVQEFERRVEERTADLSELLGHLATSWDDERRSMARTLHDSLGSSLTALTMHLSLLTQRLPQDKALQDRSAQMKQLLSQVVNANRQMQLGLWNDKLEFLGVKAAISECLAEFGSNHQMKVDAQLPEGDIACSRGQAVAILRCVEEGLRNIAAHARASSVAIALGCNDGALELSITDDGIGFNPQRIKRSQHGLRLLRERAAYLGGRLDVGPGPQQGTCLRLTLPPVSEA